jgi:hypothetical protein
MREPQGWSVGFEKFKKSLLPARVAVSLGYFDPSRFSVTIQEYLQCDSTGNLTATPIRRNPTSVTAWLLCYEYFRGCLFSALKQIPTHHHRPRQLHTQLHSYNYILK